MYASYICNNFICVFNLISWKTFFFFFIIFNCLISPLQLRHLSNLYYLDDFAGPQMDPGKDVPLINGEVVN